MDLFVMLFFEQFTAAGFCRLIFISVVSHYHLLGISHYGCWKEPGPVFCSPIPVWVFYITLFVARVMKMILGEV